MSASQNLWQTTPLLHSAHISQLLGCTAYLKLENLHPSHSFKYRGISHFVQHCKATHGPSVHVVIASGGNAGLAAAVAAHAIGVKCTVCIPHGASQSTIDLLKKQGAEVVIVGRFFLEALQHAKEVAATRSDTVVIPAYDDPILWEGHASMISEIVAQIPNKPDAIFCSVGGGGMLGGILVGCKAAGWDDVPVVALETNGSNCFYHSVSLNPGKFNPNKELPEGIDVIHDEVNGVELAHLNSFSSRASGSLGASSPAAAVVKMALTRKGGIRCVSVPDELSMQVAPWFADDHKFLVELACSTTLTAAYKPDLFSKLVPPSPSGPKTVVFIVCGGFKISLEDMGEYRDLLKADLKQDPHDYWNVMCDGERWAIKK